MLFSSIVNLFKKGNVCVTGLRGRGKDLLFGNVIARRNEEYVSNLDYSGSFNKLDINKLLVSGNNYKSLLDGNIRRYVYPYPSGSDVYISDAGIYFPSQYCNELNKLYGAFATYMALSRQLSHNNVHINVQNLNRVWDKIREQSDIYITCRRCWYLGGLVIQWITIYDKMQSCIDRVQPCRVRVPLFNKEAKIQAQIYKDKFFNQHGTVENKLLIYFNKSSHDTYYFEKLFKDGEPIEDS